MDKFLSTQGLCSMSGSLIGFSKKKKKKKNKKEKERGFHSTGSDKIRKDAYGIQQTFGSQILVVL
jgi:hypothetical protein